MSRLRSEIPPRNSTPQIHNQNSVLNPAAKFYSRSGRIPEIPQSASLSRRNFEILNLAI
ncbi:hypothetical protein [uncultured Campylobacter sp.]|uniref:hypothetical protein n=1 Tax=uncultured Campylobacter sp. TaxID=218934 RepID=UPI0026055C4F|nr:hypothetical protein [uncultured Campylobacter sp.]